MRSTNIPLPIIESKEGQRLSYLTMFYSLLVHIYQSPIKIAAPITEPKAQHSSILPLEVQSSDKVFAPKMRQ